MPAHSFMKQWNHWIMYLPRFQPTSTVVRLAQLYDRPKLSWIVQLNNQHLRLALNYPLYSYTYRRKIFALCTLRRRHPKQQININIAMCALYLCKRNKLFIIIEWHLWTIEGIFLLTIAEKNEEFVPPLAVINLEWLRCSTAPNARQRNLYCQL